MNEKRYPAARSAAPIVEAHFVRHIAEHARPGVGSRTVVPPAEVIETLIDAAFWASLRREEGYVPKISLALLPPADAVQPLLFENPLPLTTGALVGVAPAVERPGIHLGVWFRDVDTSGTESTNGRPLQIWGTTRRLPTYCLVLEVAGPGLLVVKHQRGDAGKFVNVAVLEGDEVKIIDERASSLPDCPALLTSLLGFDAPGSWVGSTNVLVQLAVSMRAHGRGGSLLVVPSATDSWRESIVQPIAYAVAPPFDELATLLRGRAQDRQVVKWADTLSDAVNAVAGLTAVDGATVLTDQYHLVAFGAKIVRRPRSPQVEQVTVTEPIQGGIAEVVHPTSLGGTRHLSAAQFVHDQRDAVALVASQDRRFTIFAWSPCDDIVHAHRVEALLL
jgi:hypothetical protein